jgi:uncharacterized membrane protein
MSLLLTSAGFFLIIHLLVSGTRLRRMAVARLGEGPFRGLFALASLIALVAMGVGFGHAGRGFELYDLGPWVAATTPLTFLAFQLIVMAFMFPNPTSAGGEAYLESGKPPPTPAGIQRVTRHPFLWGMSLWSAAHLVANGSARDLVLFGTLLVTAVVGTFSIDAKRRGAFGEQWQAYAATTSNLPFAAIVAGRTSFAPSEIGWWRPILPALIFAAFYVAHGTLFGAPLPP